MIDLDEWQVQTQSYDNEVGFIIVRTNKDGSRDVLKQGKVFHVAPDKCIDDHCGPLITVPYYELQK